MNIFKKLMSTFALGVLMTLPFSVVGAQEVVDPELCRQNPDSTLCQASRPPQELNDNTIFGPNGVLTKVARLLSIVVGVAAVIMIVVGGLQYVLASGDPTNIQNAKNTIFYAIIGLLIALTAQGIISFVLTRV